MYILTVIAGNTHKFFQWKSISLALIIYPSFEFDRCYLLFKVLLNQVIRTTLILCFKSNGFFLMKPSNLILFYKILYSFDSIYI